MTEKIVHVIDDDAAVRDSICFLLASAGIESMSHISAPEFLIAGHAADAACIVTDIRMPEMDGLDLVRNLRQKGFGAPVIVITGHGDVPLAVEAMKLGAADFIEKPFDDATLIDAIKRALEDNEETGRRSSGRAEVRRKLESLSERERQVLDGLVNGRANKIIAFDLGISPRTVEIYRANVMTKMQAGSLPELVRMVLSAGAFKEP